MKILIRHTITPILLAMPLSMAYAQMYWNESKISLGMTDIFWIDIIATFLINGPTIKTKSPNLVKSLSKILK